MNFLKKNLIDALDMLANLDRQQAYQENVPIADVPSELISAWFDDGFYAEDKEFHQLFSEEEWGALCQFNDFYEVRLVRLPENFNDLMKCPSWHEIVNEAKSTLEKIHH